MIARAASRRSPPNSVASTSVLTAVGVPHWITSAARASSLSPNALASSQAAAGATISRRPVETRSGRPTPSGVRASWMPSVTSSSGIVDAAIRWIAVETACGTGASRAFAPAPAMNAQIRGSRTVCRIPERMPPESSAGPAP